MMKTSILIGSLLFVFDARVAVAQAILADRQSGFAAAAPETSIDLAPRPQSNKAAAEFRFSMTSGEGSGGFECSVDSTTYRRCVSPYTRENLPDGQYVFCVRAVDGNGVKDETPACHSWTVDTKAPSVSFVDPVMDAGVYSKDPKISGTTTEPLCTVQLFVGDKAVGSVTSDADGKWTFSEPLGLSYGRQSLGAVATDRAGNASGRVSISVKVSTQPPTTTIVERPEQLQRSHNAVFEFSSPSGATEFECKLDNASNFTPCDEVWLVKKLEAGPHKLVVRARDIAGNVDAAPPSHEWTVDPQAAQSLCSSEPQGGCASSGGSPTLALSLLGGVFLVLTARRRRAS